MAQIKKRAGGTNIKGYDNKLTNTPLKFAGCSIYDGIAIKRRHQPKEDKVLAPYYYRPWPQTPRSPIAVPRESAFELLGRQSPHFHGLIVGGGDEVAAIAGERHRPHRPRVTFQLRGFATRIGEPQPHRSVLRSCKEHIVVLNSMRARRQNKHVPRRSIDHGH